MPCRCEIETMAEALGRVRAESDEVLYAEGPIIKVTARDLCILKERAMRNPRQRIRLCAHRTIEDSIHEMLIVHTRQTYVRPHKHVTKWESFHVIEGMADVVVFDEEGAIVEVSRIGDYQSGQQFYYRTQVSAFHTLLIQSDCLIFHETTNGPFRKAGTMFPAWAPEDHDTRAVERFLSLLGQRVESFRSRQGKVEP